MVCGHLRLNPTGSRRYWQLTGISSIAGAQFGLEGLIFQGFQ